MAAQTTFAAVDIGSNAIRLALMDLEADGKLRLIEKFRQPIRLGSDTFSVGTISENTIALAATALREFAAILDARGVTRVRAVATSALREAQNGQDVVRRLEEASGLRVEIIPGEDEARLIAVAVRAALPLASRRVLLIDVGGGSVELSLLEGAECLFRTSAPFGALRLLERFADKGYGALRAYIEHFSRSAASQLNQATNGRAIELCVGTGGNLEAMRVLSEIVTGRAFDGSVSVSTIRKLVELVEPLSLSERMTRFGLKRDRADVVAPASRIVLSLMEQSAVRAIAIPAVGLKDGVIVELAQLEADGVAVALV